MEAEIRNRITGALAGLACGDAVGTTVEFEQRGSFEPLTDMVGGGPFGLEKGQWTDDTSMALCLAHSLLHKKTFDAQDQMNRYCNWYNYGYMSSNGQCFDIGMTVSEALRNYLDSGEPFSGSSAEWASGNGSVMRLAPIPIFYYHQPEAAVFYAGESSRTTHGSALCIASCQLFCCLIQRAFRAQSKGDIWTDLTAGSCPELMPVYDGSFKQLDYHDLSGSGYVIESLISALWCFWHSRNFREAVLLAANIGNDADTTAAICGQIAGAYYGYNGIPEDWRQSITMATEIPQLATGLYQAGLTTANNSPLT